VGPINSKHFSQVNFSRGLARGLAVSLLALPVAVLAQNEAANPNQIATSQSATPALYEQAMSALQKGDIDAAENLLQRVVEQYPDWAGAWLDLSLIAYRKAQYAQAEEFLLVLEQRFSPLPQGVQMAVQQLRIQLAAHLKPTPSLAANWVDQVTQNAQHQTAVTLGAGYDNNVNAGLRFSTITLTLPDRNVELTLAPSNKPIGASFVRVGAVHQAKVSLPDVDVSFQMQAQARHYEGLPQYGNLELVPQVSVEGAAWGALTLGMQAISLNHALTYKAPILRWQKEQALPVCKLQHQVQLEDRRYVIATHLNSHWSAYKPMVQCERADQKLGVYVQSALERAASEARPGQNTRSVLVGMQHEWLNPMGLQGHRLQLRAEVQRSEDTAGYSYLLDNGNPRRLQNKLALVNWSAPLYGQNDWRWGIGLQTNRQWSNLAVFSQRNFSLESSIWRGW
jgi:hypothetical protein